MNKRYRYQAECLACGYTEYINKESKEECKVIDVCPKCYGAFVDTWHKHEYLKKNKNHSGPCTSIGSEENCVKCSTPKTYSNPQSNQKPKEGNSMVYQIKSANGTQVVKGVKRIIEKGDNFTFIGGDNSHNAILFIVPKDKYYSIEKVELTENTEGQS